MNISAVVTNEKSDWSVLALGKKVPFVWVKAVRRLDAIELFYSLDDKNYVMYRNAPFQDNTPVKIGMMAACPDGDGFNAQFDNFSVKPLPDQRRLEWLEKHK
jgi:uncharacterized protein